MSCRSVVADELEANKYLTFTGIPDGEACSLLLSSVILDCLKSIRMLRKLEVEILTVGAPSFEAN